MFTGDHYVEYVPSGAVVFEGTSQECWEEWNLLRSDWDNYVIVEMPS